MRPPTYDAPIADGIPASFTTPAKLQTTSRRRMGYDRCRRICRSRSEQGGQGKVLPSWKKGILEHTRFIRTLSTDNLNLK